MGQIFFFLNSDFGVGSSIGARALPIAKAIKGKEIEVFCRDYNPKYKNDFKLTKVIPFGQYIMKGLTALPIFVSKKIPANQMKNWLFDNAVLSEMKKRDLSGKIIIHSWDFLPRTYAYLKKNAPKAKIIQDVPIGFPNALASIKDKDILFKGENLELLEFIEKSLKYPDIFIVPSEFVKQTMETLSKRKIKVIPFGVDSKKFKPQKKSDKKFKVAFVGNINNRKGIPYLIKAWKSLKLKDAELNLYGILYPECRSVVKDAKNVNIHGFVDTAKELPKNHIYVFPSLTEGSSKSVYEAMACGLPVITTFNSGSVVREDQDGFIIPIQNIAELKKKIKYFYDDKKAVKSMGQSARKYVQNYTWENYAKNVLKVYGGLK